MITPAQLIDQAREWRGVKFLHQGSTRLGCDCLGFIAGTLAELGCPIGLEQMPHGYGRNPQAQLLEQLSPVARKIPLTAGALILIQWPHAEYPSHAAIYTGTSMIHALESAGYVVEHGYREPWLRMTRSIWTVPGVTYE